MLAPPMPPPDPTGDCMAQNPPIRRARYLYTPRYLEFDYGPHHPLRVGRLALVHELIGECGLEQDPVPVKEAER